MQEWWRTLGFVISIIIPIIVALYYEKREKKEEKEEKEKSAQKLRR